MPVEKSASQIEVGKRFEKMLRSRGPGRDDKVIRDEIESAVTELDSEFLPPSLEHCEAFERLMRAYVRTKQHDKACEVAGRTVQYLRDMDHRTGSFYYDALTAWAEKLVKIRDFSTVEELFRVEIPKTKTWKKEDAFALYMFLHSQYLYYRVKGDFESAATSYIRVMELGIEAWGKGHSQYWAIAMGYVTALFEVQRYAEAVGEWEKTIAEARKNNVMSEDVLLASQADLDAAKAQLGI